MDKTPASARSHRGRAAHLSGLLAEDAVARHLTAHGAQVLSRRWRSPSGEIDLVVRIGTCVIFVEVKKAASLTDASWRLTPAQQARICRAACDYCATLATGQETEMRFDVALVDATGRIEMIENAFGEVCP